MCVKIKRGEEVYHERDIHHKNATTKLLQIFGAVKHFIPRNSEGECESKSYIDIQSEYI